MDTYIWVMRGKVWSKNGHQTYTCLNKIELNVKNLLTILDSIVNIIRGTYVTI